MARMGLTKLGQSLLYDPPMNRAAIEAKYGKEFADKLLSDPVHGWRADNGIELIHREPTKSELRRIYRNWKLMPASLRRKSDEKSMELFGISNAENYARLVKESSDISTPEDLLKHMGSFRYGLKYRGKFISPDDQKWDGSDEFNRRAAVQMPKSLEKSRTGTCYDQSLYAYDKLKRMGRDPRMVFMFRPTDDGYTSHTSIVYKDKDNKYRNFEHAWESQVGIHKPFATHDKAVKDLQKRWLGQYKGESTLNSDVDVSKLLGSKDIPIGKFTKALLGG